MDHVDPFAVPVKAEMAVLHGPGDDVGPEGGDTFARRIANRGLDDLVGPGIGLPKRAILRRSIIVEGERRDVAVIPGVSTVIPSGGTKRICTGRYGRYAHQ